MKPVWYLDVDGVINIVRPFRPYDIPEEYWRDGNVAGLPIRWDARVVDFLNEVHRAGLVEVVWLTTWENRAPELLAPVLAMDEWRIPRQSMRGIEEGAYGWWKFESIKLHAEEDHLDERDMIWTDDDLSYSWELNPKMKDWVDERKQKGLQTLGISPRTSRGLTMAHLDEIRKVISH